MIKIIIGPEENILDDLREKLQSMQIIDYNESSINELLKLYLSNSLLDDVQNIAIINPLFLINKSNKLKKKELDPFSLIINSQSKNNLYFILKKEPNREIDYISKYIKKIEIEYFDENKIITNFLEKEEINISIPNLEYLKENLNENYSLKNELLRLSLLNNRNELTKEFITSNLVYKSNVTIFKFIEYIVDDNKTRAYEVYKKDIRNLGYTPEQIIAILASQIRFMLQVKILLKTTSINDIAKILKTSSYRIKMSKDLISKSSFMKLKTFFANVAYYDYLIKSGQTKEEDVILNFMI